MNKQFFLENLGCAKNQVDAEIMIAALEAAGWERTDDAETASTILVNTCGFIEPAKQESINVTLEYLGALPDARVVMTGCLSQRYPEELAAELPEVAGVFGNRAPARIPEFLASLEAGGPRTMVPSGGLESHQRTHLLSFPGSAFVKVSEGCDNRCTFCAIPLIRGSMRSKRPDAVIREIEELVARGIREINLVAQDLASYGRDLDGADPVALLRSISALEGDFWVRLLYVYPEHFPDAFFPVLRADPRLLPYFDIPFQHASREVLRRMGRPGTAEKYLSLVSRIRSELPDAVLRSTLLVGFFGETESAFEELLAFQAEAKLDWLGVFPYSPEEGTPAMSGNNASRGDFATRGDFARRDDATKRRDAAQREAPVLDVSPELAARRAALVEERQRAITHAQMERFVGRDLDVLVEELVPEEPLALGRCYAQAPEVDGSVVINLPDDASPLRARVEPGQFVRCRIVRRNGLDLEAVPL